MVLDRCGVSLLTKVRKDALHLPKPSLTRIKIPNDSGNQHLKSIFKSLTYMGISIES